MVIDSVEKGLFVPSIVYPIESLPLRLASLEFMKKRKISTLTPTFAQKAMSPWLKQETGLQSLQKHAKNIWGPSHSRIATSLPLRLEKMVRPPLRMSQTTTVYLLERL